MWPAIGSIESAIVTDDRAFWVRLSALRSVLVAPLWIALLESLSQLCVRTPMPRPDFATLGLATEEL